MGCSTKFWFNDPSALFKEATIIPSRDMTDNELLNALTRAIIVISLLLLLLSVGQAIIFLVFGLVVVVLLGLSINRSKESKCPSHPPGKHRVEHFRCGSPGYTSYSEVKLSGKYSGTRS
jgi:hypothetical protein